MGLEALFQKNDGTEHRPGEHAPWDAWVSAGRTRAWMKDDPILDWLERHGKGKGFLPDHELEGYDERTDFLPFVFEKGHAFEASVVQWLRDRYELVELATGPADARDPSAVERTFRAMKDSVPILTQAPLWNPENETYGMADLVIRSDVLRELFPDDLAPSDASQAAPHLGGRPWHYRVVDVKFTTLALMADGHAAKDHLPYQAQVWTYNEALGRIQGLTPEAGYLLGRGWRKGNGKERGHSALERLSRVEHARTYRDGSTLAEHVRDACRWVRRVRTQGGAWQALPVPTRPELRPNLRHASDGPWHQAKRRIATELEDLTCVPRVTPKARLDALEQGIERWTDPRCSATACGVPGEIYRAQVDAVIQANQSAPDGPVVFPATVRAKEDLWRTPAPMEFFVDFETVSDLDDDFTRFPKKGGQPLIFMVGCGHVDETGAWSFRVFTADRLVPDDERKLLDDWLSHMKSLVDDRGTSLDQARLYHWSPAEQSTLKTAYNSAAERHGLTRWDHLPWVDLLKEVVKREPVTVRQAFGFGLKAIAKAMHAHGLIETVWGDGPTDGLGAMVGAWWCHHEAESRGISMRTLDLMKEIEAYNEVDCRVMQEVLDYLRRHR